MINVTSNNVSTLAGVPHISGFLNGPATSATFNSPSGVAINPSNGNIIVADTYNHAIRLINVTSNNVSTLAGTGSSGYLDGPATSAKFNSPVGVAVDPSNGNIMVADTHNDMLRMINVTSNIVSTLATSLIFPNGVAVDPLNGNIIVADTNDQMIKLFNITSKKISIIAGTGGYGDSNGPASSATFAFPCGVAVDPLNGNIIVADTNNQMIRMINVTSNTVSTLAGNGFNGYLNGLANSSELSYPPGIAINPLNRNIIFSDANWFIRSIELINISSVPIAVPYSLNASAIGGTYVFLIWNAPYDPTSINFMISYQVNGSNGPLTNISTSDLSQTYSLLGLEPNTTYDIAVASQNPIGSGPESSRIFVKTCMSNNFFSFNT